MCASDTVLGVQQVLSHHRPPCYLLIVSVPWEHPGVRKRRLLWSPARPTGPCTCWFRQRRRHETERHLSQETYTPQAVEEQRQFLSAFKKTKKSVSVHVEELDSELWVILRNCWFTSRCGSQVAFGQRTRHWCRLRSWQRCLAATGVVCSTTSKKGQDQKRTQTADTQGKWLKQNVKSRPRNRRWAKGVRRLQLEAGKRE
jgi:hypothetical protein